MKKVKIGVLGGYRGRSMAKYAKAAENAELVAICDKSETALQKQKDVCGENVAYYTDFEEFIKHDILYL